MPVRSSFSGLGAAARGIELLEELGMRCADWQRSVINDAIQRQKVAAVVCGQELLGEVPFDQIVTRENNILSLFCEWMGVKYPGVDVVERALRNVEAKWGRVTIHDRVILGGLDMKQLFQAVYGFNEYCRSEGKMGIKLAHEPNKEWWRTDKDVQSLPTELSVNRQDLAAVMLPTDLAGRPFNLNLKEQIAWAKEQGGDDLVSIEEGIYLFLRSAYERALPLWAVGSCRTRNTLGFAGSLGLGWDADGGFFVSRWGRWLRGSPGWYLGALPRKSLKLGR